MMEALETLSQKEREQFKTVCNQLLSCTFVVRTTYQGGKGRLRNPDYSFLTAHFELVSQYLSVLDWDLRRDEYNGYYYVVNSDETNRLNLTKIPTAILLALRMIYDENQNRVGLEQDVICTVREVMDKVVTDYPILSTRPNMDEVRRAMTIFENHRIVERIEGRFGQTNCQFAILPTILTVVSSEKLEAVVADLRKEENGSEETEENSADELAVLL